MRTIKDIYDEAVRERNKRLELKEFDSNSKVSILNGLTWAFSAVIYSFEVLLNTFCADVSNIIDKKINGTPLYYANALLEFQKGDELVVRADGLAFGYASTDETKRIITQVSFEESSDDQNLDNKLILKVAQGQKGKLSPLSQEDLVLVLSYLHKIKFAGTRIEVSSNEGDVLIPIVSVYYDGSVREAEMYDLIDAKLNEFIMGMNFDSCIYASKVIETIKKTEHVTDVYIDPEIIPEQGIFLASYNSDRHLMPPEKIGRMMQTSSGYLKESTGRGEECDTPNFRQSIKLIVDRR